MSVLSGAGIFKGFLTFSAVLQFEIEASTGSLVRYLKTKQNNFIHMYNILQLVLIIPLLGVIFQTLFFTLDPIQTQEL